MKNMTYEPFGESERLFVLMGMKIKSCCVMCNLYCNLYDNILDVLTKNMNIIRFMCISFCTIP